ncbi:MAG TPA: NAD/NADP octopine/nopaline dehydrogenase family protein [Actinomycetota bacterium]|nr:NAD/NADP octopine/nopaline dehydrogenase family protein [Actinomycetota bacterium]
MALLGRGVRPLPSVRTAVTTVAVLGAGAGGMAAAADLARAGHAVRLWTRSPRTLAPLLASGSLRYTGVLGEGTARPELLTTDLARALAGAEAVLVCVPALAHPELFAALAEARVAAPVVLNPGGVGGALEFRARFLARGVPPPPVAELSTLTYVARKHAPDQVTVTGVAARVWGATLPGGEAAMEAARGLYSAVAPAPDVLFTSLSNVNLVLHPPGAVLGAAWVEATGGDFRFYVEGMTPGVVRVLEALDEERQAVGRAFGHELPTLVQEMAAIGTADPEAARRGDVAAAIRGGAANATIRAPDSLSHRYYLEDLGFGLLPFRELAQAAGVAVPTADALWTLGRELVGSALQAERTAATMGVEGLGAARLRALVRGR